MNKLDPNEHKKLNDIKKRLKEIKKLVKSLIKDITDKKTKEDIKKELTLLFAKTILKNEDFKNIKLVLDTSKELKKSLKKSLKSLGY